MKRILLTICLCLVMAGTSYGATCTAQGAGNWWTAATWSCGGETRVPAAGDDVALAGYVITWDVANGVRIPDTSGSLGTVTSTGTAGQITIALDDASCHGDGTCSITATSITAGTKPTNSGIIYATSTGSVADHILHVNADITGGSNTSSCGVYNAGPAKIYVTGNATGGSGTSAHGVVNGASGGGVNIAGDVTGGSGTTAYGLFQIASSNGCTITSGDIIAGSGSRASGVYADTAGGTITLTCSGGKGNIKDSTASMAITGRSITWSPGNSCYYQLPDGTTKLWVDTDPGVANVKKDTTYYFQSGTVKTGTYGGGGAWGF